MIALVLCRLCVHEHPVPVERGQHTCDDVQGLEVSLGRFFQDLLIQGKIGDGSLESRVFLFELLQTFRLVEVE